MSHFSIIKTELKNLMSVEAALRRMGIEYDRDSTIIDYYGNTRSVDIVAHLSGQGSVGFSHNKSSGVVELVGDWYGKTMNKNEFLANLKSNYAREQVLDSLEQQGVDLSRVKEHEEPDGSVVFELPLEGDDMEALITG